MIPAPAEAAKNTNSAVAETNRAHSPVINKKKEVTFKW